MTYYEIDWAAHQQAIKILDKHKVSLVKYVHGILPVRERTHKLDQRYDHCCQCCGEPKESEKHLWTCRSTGRQKCRESFIRGLFKLLDDDKTHASIMTVALEGAGQFLKGIEFPEFEFNDPENQRLFNNQSRIGWKNFMRGRISKSWTIFQEQHQNRQGLQRRKNTWTKDLAQYLLQQFVILWQNRNEAQHGNSTQTRMEATATKYSHEIDFFYQHADLVPPEVGNTIFKNSPEQMANETIDTQHAWLQNWRNILTRYIKVSKPTQHPLGIELSNP